MLDAPAEAGLRFRASQPTGCSPCGPAVARCPAVVDGHIVVPAGMTAAGANRIEFEFTAGDEALNRNDDFLYVVRPRAGAAGVPLLRPAGSEGPRCP